MANTYLTRTPSGAGTSNKIFTLSVWVKRTGFGQLAITGSGDSNGYNNVFLEFNGSNQLRFAQLDSSSFPFEYITTRVFRDVNAWYHIVCTCDSTNNTEADRIKIYVNGVRETSFSTTNHPPLNQVFKWNDARVHSIGREGAWDARYFDGLMSHFHNIDGTAYQASTFGSTDSTTGEWKINASPSVNYGTNGWFMFKDDNSLNDDSGNGNNFSLGSGTLTKTEDNPSNIFCTLNSLATGNSAPTFSKGNNRVVANASGYQFSCGTIAVPLTGKWYWEVKANDNVNGSSTEYLIGAVLESRLEASGNFAEFAADGITQYGSVGTGIGQNDIIGVSVDRTAATLKIYKNNSLILTKSSLPAELIYPMVTVYGSVSADANFGNGYFGGTAVSSAGTNASNNGIFEYDVIPSDANALSTKGLNL